MEMGGNFCQILELGGGTTIKGRRVLKKSWVTFTERQVNVNIFSQVK